MNLFKTIIFACLMLLATDASAQWDTRGCAENGINLDDPKSMESSLWTFRSNVWDGYIDFMEGGKYWTHWGLGTWTVSADHKAIHLANDYNDKTYELAFADNGYRYEGVRNDGLRISGRLICAKYEGPLPEIPDDVKPKIMGVYNSLLARLPTGMELRASYRKYLENQSIDDVIHAIAETQEYKDIAAAKAAAAPPSTEKQLGW